MGLSRWLRKALGRTPPADAAAYSAFDQGQLRLATEQFSALVAAHPRRDEYAYMLGLA